MSEDSDIEEKINILILGNTAVGKTSYILKYTEDEFQEMYLATVGIDFKVKVVKINNVSYRVYFYDTTGQEKYKSISFNIIKNAQGIIIMYDITNKSSFDSVTQWITSVQELKGKKIPMILIGNKIDKEERRVIETENGEALAAKFHLDFFETSNKTGINIQESALCLINKIIERRETGNDSFSMGTKSSKLKSSQHSKKKKMLLNITFFS